MDPYPLTLAVPSCVSFRWLSQLIFQILYFLLEFISLMLPLHCLFLYIRGKKAESFISPSSHSLFLELNFRQLNKLLETLTSMNWRLCLSCFSRASICCCRSSVCRRYCSSSWWARLSCSSRACSSICKRDAKPPQSFSACRCTSTHSCPRRSASASRAAQSPGGPMNKMNE